MAKHCDNCGLSYPDTADTCPHCAASAVEVVEEADEGAEIVTVEAADDEPVVDLADMDPAAEEAVVKDSGVDLGSAPGGGGSSASGVGVGAPGSDSGASWASLVEEFETPSGKNLGAAGPETPAAGPPSDADVVELAEAVEEAEPASGTGGSAVDVSGLSAEAGASPSDLNLVPDALEAGASTVYLGDAAQSGPGSGSGLDLGASNRPGSGSDLDLGAEAAATPPASSSGIDLNLALSEPGSEAPLLEEEALLGGESAVNLGGAVEPGESPSGLDAIAEAVESGVDLGAKQPAAGSGSAGAAGDSAVDLGAPLATDSDIAGSPAAVNLGARQPKGLPPSEEDAAAALLEDDLTAGGSVAPPNEEDAGGLDEEVTADASGEAPMTKEEEGALASVGAGTDGDAPEPEGKKGRKKGGVVPFLGGGLVGALVTAGALAGVWFAGLLPEKNPAPRPNPNAGPRPPVQASVEPPSVERARTQLASGDVAKAADMMKDLQPANPDDAEFLAARGEALWLASLQQLARDNKQPTAKELADLDTVKRAKEDLEKAKTADALFWLGHIAELTEGPDAARAKYKEGLQQFPKERRFQSALDSLDVRTPAKAGGAVWLPPGAGVEEHALVLALVALQPQQGGGQADPNAPQAQGQADTGEEAAPDFWAAVKLAQQHKYDDAVKAIEKAREIHNRMRVSRFRKAQNPINDPNELVFLTACDELKAYWQVRDRLGKAGYVDLTKRVEPAEMLTALSKLETEKKALAAIAMKLKEEKYDAADLGKAVAQLLDDKKTADTKVADTLAALKTAGAKEAADPVKAVMELETAKKAADTKVADTAAALKDAGVDDAASPGKAVKELDTARKAAEKKLADTQAALKAAGVMDADPAKGVQQAAAARDAANATLDAVAKKLTERKYLPEKAPRADVPAGLDKALGDVDHPVVVAIGQVAGELGGLGGKATGELAKAANLQGRLAASQMEVVKLQGYLGERWTPKQMLDVWLPVLEDRSQKDLSEMALKDVQRVLNDKPTPAALCLKGLAARNQGNFAEARATLKDVMKNAAEAPDPKWARAAEAALMELSDPAAFYVPTVDHMRAQHWHPEALGVVEEALKAFPKDEFPKAHAALLALRGLVRFELVRAAADKVTPDLFKDSLADAAAATEAGETVEGNYLSGRIAEDLGDLARAEGFYRAAVEAYEANRPDPKDRTAFLKAHPVSDPAGSRYQVALARVVLEQARRPSAAPAVPPAAPKVEPKTEGAKAVREVAAAPVSALEAGSVTLLVWSGCCPSPFLVPYAMVEADPFVGPQGGGLAPNPRLDEAIRLAEAAITAGDNRGYLIKGEAVAEKGQWTEGLVLYVEGLRRLLPDEQSRGLVWLVHNHPAFKRPDGIRPPDPGQAEAHFANGLRYYFDRRFADAEKELLEAVHWNDQDARYQYFLGLARLPQAGKRDQALEDFRQAARLEQRNLPPRAVVSITLERVQGAARRVLNDVREQAAREAGAGP